MTDAELIQMLTVLKQSVRAVEYLDAGQADTLLTGIKDSSATWVLTEAIKWIEGMKLLIEWAVDCDFGYGNIPDEYAMYKDDIANMSYTDGLIYIAVREAERRKEK